MPRRHPETVSEYLPLCWCACLGGLMASGLFWFTGDPKFAILAAGSRRRVTVKTKLL